MGDVDDRRRIGVFGGSFDPVHIGHLAAAVAARHACRLDRVLLVVANHPWQKTRLREVSSAEARFAAVSAAVAELDGIEASRMEIDRGGVSYTIDTLRELRSQFPDVELVLVGGSDMAAGLSSWRDPGAIAELASLAVVNRVGPVLPPLDPMWRAQRVVMSAIEVSSTDLRRRFEDGRPLDVLIPPAALALLRASGLYAGLQPTPDRSDPPG